MMRLLQAGLAGLVLVTAPSMGFAQFFGTPGGCGLAPCANPCNSCGHVQCTCNTLRPVVETSYRSEQYVAERQVTQLECQAEPFAETVPVTTYKTVTVDEGKYEMVWVPKVVAKQVPETQYVQRTGYRMVPRQITRSIPEVRTRLVPQQTVRYVPEQTQMTFAVPYAAPLTASLPWQPAPYAYTPPVVSAAPLAPINSWSSAAAIPEMPAIDVRTRTATSPYSSAASLGPTPDPRFLDTPSLNYPETDRDRIGYSDPLDDWQTVPSRNSLGSLGSRPVEAPTAATVWNAKRLYR